jgi:hydrogenase maturation protease
MNSHRPILVAACGNALAGNDAFGPTAARLVAARAPPQVEVIDLSLAPSGLLDFLPNRAALILIDAVNIPDRSPDQLVDLDCSDIQSLPLIIEPARSSHNLGLAWQLTLADSLKLLPPRVRLLALTIDSAAIGQVTSPALEAQARRCAEATIGWCRKYLGELEEITKVR